jgi:hypothetical protein
MAIASITQWLESPDKNYNRGRLLYEQYGKNRITFALISSGSGPYHFCKLQEALEELNSRVDLVPKQIIVADYNPEPIRIPGKAEINYTDAPDLILQLRTRKSADYAQARKLFESIRWMDSKANRLAAGLQILDLMDKVNEAWSIIDEWKEKGHVRAVEQQKQISEVAEMTHPQLLQEEKRLGPNISKDKSKIEACKDPRKLVQLTARYQERTLRMEQVKRRLNEFV